MYKCNNCEARFDEPFCYEEGTGVYADMGEFGEMEEVVDYTVCPECGSTAIETIPLCDVCGNECDSDNSTICSGCYEDMRGLIAIAFENFQRMHPEAKDDDMYGLIYDLWENYDDEQMKAR